MVHRALYFALDFWDMPVFSCRSLMVDEASSLPKSRLQVRIFKQFSLASSIFIQPKIRVFVLIVLFLAKFILTLPSAVSELS